ncbi:MFS transporter [Promethearchaeum syntrophicum]|uniref:MFS transporter n=1 Tax=Promethearchaeum syntrophicum TaxID=2594042 RepID=A0A5B9DDF2_9ARCH|nr:MFS transporter [Candidatus Prometheoarchaeum syntrophicum]QEE17061.1 bicyclomycin/multidrug efflux system [Candidatus Prometheoarchaeum syntrophicum]
MQNLQKHSFNRMVFTLMVINFTEILGFSLMMPVLPFLAKFLGLNIVQIGLLGSIFSFCQFFASPITGKLSDRYGRKPLLIISQLSTFTGFLLLGLADSVPLLIIARVVDGLFGSNMTVIQATISDITEPKDRTRIYSISSGVFGAGLIIGPALGGILAEINYSIPMYSAAAISLVSILLVIIFLPETYHGKSQSFSLKFSDIIPTKSLYKYWKNRTIRYQIIMMISYTFGFMLFINNFTLIAIEDYSITTLYAGYYRTYIGILRVILQFLFINRLLSKFGENRTLVSGIIALMISMILMIFSSEKWMVFIPMTFLAYGTGVARPILTSQLTKSVSKSEFATVLGVNNSLNSLGQIITPILGGAMLMYLGSMWIMVSSILIYVLFLISKKKRDIHINDISLKKDSIVPDTIIEQF